MNSLLKFIFPGPEKMTEWLRAYATLSEDLDWVPRTMRTSHELMTSCSSSFKGAKCLLLTSLGMSKHMWCIYMHVDKDSYT